MLGTRIYSRDRTTCRCRCGFTPIGGTFAVDTDEAAGAALAINLIVVSIHHSKADPKEFKEKVEAKSDIKVCGCNR